MATIKLYNGKTFEQMNDTEKQDLGSKLIHNEIGHCFSSTFSALWDLIDESHVEYDDMYSLLGAYDYDTAVKEHIQEMDVEELQELSDEWIGDLEVSNDNRQEAETACYNAIVESDDLEQYSYDNDLDPTFDEAYEHWIVSPWLAEQLPYTADVTGLKIWARFTTGQAISLDHQIQTLAFDIYSDEVDESEHIKKVDAIKAIISAACKSDIAPLVEKVILENDTAYSLAVNNAADYDARKKLENRISNNVKKVRETLEQHNINF